MLTDAEFMQQAQLVYEERGRMLDFALDKYMAKEDGGFLFFYYSTVDLCCHMMWRHSDPEHPFYDEVIASQDSSQWSSREGSTWKDVVADLYMKMDPILGRIRSRVGEDTPIMVMSDHGFAAYRRKFSLNTWLLDNGYLVLNEGVERELPSDHKDHKAVNIFVDVDWEKTRAYGMGFNGLYLNRVGREAQGIVDDDQASALLAEIKSKLEALQDDGTAVILSASLATEIYAGERLDEAPDILVGYNRGYGNSDEASLGRVTASVLSDNVGGTFNGSHLMDPSVVRGTLLTNRPVRLDDPRLEDLTVEILGFYNVQPDESMKGRPVLD
jgi:predicted AlkP superfamily phosphohydrolase/phosphomutase